MPIKAEIICDSLSPTGDRITTFKLRFHRFILPEFNTHRQFSRNAASSRAIPVKKMMEAIKFDPAIPVKWGKNQPGMASNEELSSAEQERCLQAWLTARDNALATVSGLLESVPLHKQVANRLLEPFMWTEVIMTATGHPSQLENFFKLRRDGDNPQPEMKALADAMKAAYDTSSPVKLGFGDWHLPMVDEKDLINFGTADSIKRSVARCARVSYLNHDGTSSDIQKDIQLYETLKNSGHLSPFEHQAKPHSGWWANFYGWKQLRYAIERGENA